MPIAKTVESKPPLSRCWFVVSMKGRWNGGVLDRSKKPTTLYTSLVDASAEAHRLAHLHPKQQYAIFECLGFVQGSISKSPAATARKRELCPVAG